MSTSERTELGPPSIDDFEVLKEAFLDLASNPLARIRSYNTGLALYIGIERIYSDTDFLAWPPLSICLRGIIKTIPEGCSLDLRYREKTHNNSTYGSGISHDYSLGISRGELVEYGQSIRACPKVPERGIESPEILFSDHKLDQVQSGRELLRQNCTSLMELTAGDCGVLFDRMCELSV